MHKDLAGFRHEEFRRDPVRALAAQRVARL
jgi:hypothetical protein